MTDPSWFAAQHYFIKGACEALSADSVSAPPEDLVVVRRGLFRRERRSPRSLEEYRELFRSNSVEATIASWEETARSVLRDAGLPDHLNNVILEPGGSWREFRETATN